MPYTASPVNAASAVSVASPMVSPSSFFCHDQFSRGSCLFVFLPGSGTFRPNLLLSFVACQSPRSSVHLCLGFLRVFQSGRCLSFSSILLPSLSLMGSSSEISPLFVHRTHLKSKQFLLSSCLFVTALLFIRRPPPKIPLSLSLLVDRVVSAFLYAS